MGRAGMLAKPVHVPAPGAGRGSQDDARVGTGLTGFPEKRSISESLCRLPSLPRALVKGTLRPRVEGTSQGAALGVSPASAVIFPPCDSVCSPIKWG